MDIKKVSLKNYTSLRIGGEADMVVVSNEDELVEVIVHAKAEGFRVHILGEGTNTVFGDNLEKLLVIKNEIKGIKYRHSRAGGNPDLDSRLRGNDTIQNIDDDCILLIAGAGEKWDDIVKFSVEKNLWGIENMSLIPGNIGASPVQNIGAYGVELKDVLVSARAYDTKENIFVELSNSDCHFGYRDSLFKHEVGRYIIVSVTIKLSKTSKPTLSYKPLDTLLNKENLTSNDVRELVVSVRTEKLPDCKLYPNAGSFFKNPVVTLLQGKTLKNKYPEIPLREVENSYKVPAAWLIEHVAEMKGARIGDIGTWPNQPLVIVNYGEATVGGLEDFVDLIVQKVKEKTDITLEQEVNLV